jgi:hypothetical protein
MVTTKDFIESAKCELIMSVGETTKIKWTGNGPGRLIAVLTLIETLAKHYNISFDDLIVYLCQAHEEIEQAEVVDGEEGE